ncbi:hypothetical protein GCM10023332_01470 [Luteimonas vadosa]|uniref:Lipoprotein n=2 Tax=Luteimonas vadosa TaxID=1165507 RepID=A0ABP9DQ81_9GAMM
MNKLKSLGTALALCWLATACTDDGAPAEPAANPPAPASAPTADPAAPVQTPARLSNWETPLESATESPLCYLDAVNGMPATGGAFQVSANAPVVMEGWLSTLDLQAPPEVTIILDGAMDFGISGATGITRDDVAQAYNAPQLARSGFKAELSELAVEPGTYTLLLSHESAGTTVVCKPGLALQVQ